MDDATQKLVDEVMRSTPMRVTDEGIVMQASEIEAMIADALEAAQRRAEEDHAEANRLVNEYAVKAGNLALDLEAAYDQMESFVEAGVLARINGQYEPSASLLSALEASQHREPTHIFTGVVSPEGIAEVVRNPAWRPPVSPDVLPTPGAVATDAMTGLAPGAPVDPEFVHELIAGVIEADRERRLLPVSPEVREAPSDAAIVDLYWKTSGDDWAIPEWLMVKFGRALLARFSVPSQPVYDEEAIARWLRENHDPCITEGGCDFGYPDYRHDAAALVAALRAGELS